MNFLRTGQKIKDIVAENYVYAAILHVFGIPFYLYPEHTLAEVCKVKGLDMASVCKRLDAVQAHAQKPLDRRLYDLSVDILIGYLKKAHRAFIRHKLPYMAELIGQIEPEHFDQPEIAKDLKFVFPIFAEDFVQHIYEEEKYNFGHIEQLALAVSDPPSAYELFNLLHTQQINAMTQQHLEDDDEMEGIRELTNNFEISNDTGLYTRVVYSELLAFEQDLRIHARIENEILLPKAAELEKQAHWLLDSMALRN